MKVVNCIKISISDYKKVLFSFCKITYCVLYICIKAIINMKINLLENNINYLL